jgi:hypothetical protein
MLFSATAPELISSDGSSEAFRPLDYVLNLLAQSKSDPATSVVLSLIYVVITTEHYHGLCAIIPTTRT